MHKRLARCVNVCKMRTLNCGNSSAGRAQPCQGWGREFESRFPLQIRKKRLNQQDLDVFFCLNNI